ncbi:MAG: DUF7010 family protein [Gemmatimonadales bacterium]
MTATPPRTLDEQRAEFARHRFLAGLMWVPFSWILQHWVGLFHDIARTVLVLAAWYLFPEQRFVVIPAVIVAIYLVTIFVLMRRPRQ